MSKHPPADTPGSNADVPSDLRFDIDDETRERQRDLRAHALHAVYVPRLRLFGSVIISAWLYLHMRFISGGPVGEWAFASVVLFAWGVVAWIILYRFYHRRARFDLANFFLAGDLFLWTWLIYLTGAERSWLFILLSVRAADQAATTFRRTLFFAHLGVILYVALLGIIYLRGEPVDWGLGWTKAVIIYGFNLYLALAARTMETMRRKMSSAIQYARHLILDLAQNRNELQTALSRSAELERSLAQAQKLESLGHMATGIAHDFNNTMMSVRPWADLIAKKHGDDPQLANAAAQIANAVDRASDVTSQLLRFAQPRPPKVQSLDLGALLQQQLETLHISLPENIQVKVEQSTERCRVEIDAAQFAQVIANLTLNARDAMPEGGVMTFRIREADRGEQGRSEIGPESHVAFEVSDTGIGIDDVNASKIFNPFFTTKPFGRGSGLGLAIAHQTVQQAGGIMAVRSRPGEGSTFTILLPCSSPLPSVQDHEAPVGEVEQKLTGLAAMIIDDDSSVAEGIRLMLEIVDATVTVKSSGVEALEHLDGGYRPDLIILDLGMPVMSGVEVHAAIRGRNLSIPIIISSGYRDPERLDRVLIDAQTFYLQKPYGLDDLLETVERAVNPEQVA